MAKIDVSTIEGFADMTAEQKAEALANYEFPDPDYTGYVKKDVFDKTASELASWKKKHNELLSEEERKKLVNRLKRVEGQIRGIIRMLENDAYCNDILIQSAAVNAAVNAFNKELLASHIRTCVARDIREGKDETIDELVATLQKLMK